jgi:di/tricarboxylate transporter
MTFDILIVILVLVFIIISLYTELLGPAFTFLVGIVVLGVFHILTPTEILSGMANDQIAVIILLLLLGDIIQKTRVLDNLFDKVFSRAKTHRGFLGRMSFMVAAASGFINNTPLVAIMLPYVLNWSKRYKIAPSKLLIPLSYATILGGCVTLIGTSTNLIVNGMVTNPLIIPGLKPLGLFDFTPVGLPMAIIGSFFLIFFSFRILPSRKEVFSDFTAQTREYLVEAQIRNRSSFIGKSIEDSNLRNLPGLYLVEINREGVSLPAVSPSFILRAGDILVFAGETDTIVEMINSTSGLVLTQVGMFTRKTHTEALEVVISHNSSLINKTVKETSFRGRFDAAILAMHRNGERIPGKIGEIKLRAGDVLLILAGDDFFSRSADTNDFYLITRVKEFRKMKWYQVLTMFGGAALAIFTSAMGWISLFMALILLMILINLMKITSPKDLPKSIDYNLAIIIVLSLALGTAMIKTGMADLIAQNIVHVFIPYGPVVLLGAIFIITNVLAAYITSKAAAAIIFPISVTAALQLGLPTPPFILVVAFGAAANFITPIGYQTNLMVYGPGGYNFKDYMKIGLPLTVLYLVVTVVILSWWYGLG